jgi:hypothetical protein
VAAVHFADHGSSKNARLDHREVGRYLAQRKVVAGVEIEPFYPVPVAQ